MQFIESCKSAYAVAESTLLSGFFCYGKPQHRVRSAGTKTQKGVFMATKSSASEFGRDHGLIHEAVVTSRKAGWSADEWAKLAHSEETMRSIRGVLHKDSRIVINTMSLEEICRRLLMEVVRDGMMVLNTNIMNYESPAQFSKGEVAGMANLLEKLLSAEYVIDCDADPFIPDGWTVEEHRKGGQFNWDKEAQKDALYLDKGQENGKGIKEGNTLRKVLAGKLVLNANVLDYLLEKPYLIPEEWKNKTVFFWGTIYCDRYDNLCIRHLSWDGGRWDWDVFQLDCGWYDNNPAAVSAR